MKAVRNINTKRLIWREEPDFEPGKGIANAAGWYHLSPGDLEEIEIKTEEWEIELALRKAETPPSDRQVLDAFMVQTTADINELKAAINTSRNAGTLALGAVKAAGSSTGNGIKTASSKLASTIKRIFQ